MNRTQRYYNVSVKDKSLYISCTREEENMTIQELEQCIALYGNDIYSFCRHLTNDRESADDLYQDTFLEAMKKIKDIRYMDNPKSYFLSISIRIWKNKT